MAKSYIIKNHGNSEVLKIQDTAIKKPTGTEVLIKQTSIGVNFIDIYQRKGLYPNDLPFTPGCEAAGIVEAIGEKVEKLRPGDRVAYATAQNGAYTTHKIIDQKYLINLPNHISNDMAAACLLKGLTVHSFVRRTFFIRPNDLALVHAAAGGTGTILCQWLKSLNAKVIGTVGSDEKIALAKKNGCYEVINYNKEDFHEKVMSLTNNQGVGIVYDGVGKDTVQKSIACLNYFGLMVSYGASSGVQENIDPSWLAAKSTFFTRPSLFHYKSHRMELILSANELFTLIKDKQISFDIKPYKFEDAPLAHQDLENRKLKALPILKIE